MTSHFLGSQLLLLLSPNYYKMEVHPEIKCGEKFHLVGIKNIMTSQEVRTVSKGYFFFLLWRYNPTRVMASSLLRLLDHTQRRAKVGRTPLDE